MKCELLELPFGVKFRQWILERRVYAQPDITFYFILYFLAFIIFFLLFLYFLHDSIWIPNHLARQRALASLFSIVFHPSYCLFSLLAAKVTSSRLSKKERVACSVTTGRAASCMPQPPSSSTWPASSCVTDARPASEERRARCWPHIAFSVKKVF